MSMFVCLSVCLLGIDSYIPCIKSNVTGLKMCVFMRKGYKINKIRVTVLNKKLSQKNTFRKKSIILKNFL